MDDWVARVSWALFCLILHFTNISPLQCTGCPYCQNCKL
jgi:hypothetical protein